MSDEFDLIIAPDTIKASNLTKVTAPSLNEPPVRNFSMTTFDGAVSWVDNGNK